MQLRTSVQTTSGSDISVGIARRVQTGSYGSTADVCSVTWARAAHAGEHRE